MVIEPVIVMVIVTDLLMATGMGTKLGVTTLTTRATILAGPSFMAATSITHTFTACESPSTSTTTMVFHGVLDITVSTQAEEIYTPLALGWDAIPKSMM